ncbi:MAG TPA: PTS system mannose/fructose/sorbose family transporter subunit IID [Longimicrobiales bacterium]
MAGRERLPGVFRRSFAIQGSWNFETLVGYGFAYALLPVLRVAYRDRPDELARALARHSRLFNTHPYLSPVALGAVARLEVEGKPADTIERFKAAVRGALGGLGDRLVWAGWRPVCILTAIGGLLAGAHWWVVVVGFLVVYNIGHIGLRVWSFRVGWERSTGIATTLRSSWVWEAERVLRALGPALLGACVVLLLSRGTAHLNASSAGWVAAGAVAVVGGIALGGRARRPLEVLLLILALTGYLWNLR